MYEANLIAAPTTLSDGSDPLEHLRDQLQDLLLIHLQHLTLETHLTPELPSTFLKELRYVSGEKSVAKSFMRWTLRVGPDEEAGPADVILTLELNVRTKTC